MSSLSCLSNKLYLTVPDTLLANAFQVKLEAKDQEIARLEKLCNEVSCGDASKLL